MIRKVGCHYRQEEDIEGMALVLLGGYVSYRENEVGVGSLGEED